MFENCKNYEDLERDYIDMLIDGICFDNADNDVITSKEITEEMLEKIDFNNFKNLD